MPKQPITPDQFVKQVADTFKAARPTKRTLTQQSGDAGTQGGQKFVNPLNDVGQMIAGGESGALEQVPAGTEGQVVKMTDVGAGVLKPRFADEDAAVVALLDDIGDVNAPTPADGDVLTWDSTPGEWVPAAPTGGGSGAPTTATYITQTPDAGLSAEQALSALSTGLLKVTTGTGVLSAAGASDLPTGIDAAKIADGSVSNTEFQYINSLTGNVQAQIDALSGGSGGGSRLIAGRYYDLAAFRNVTYGESLSIAANVLEAFQFPFDGSAIDTVGIVVSTAAAAGNRCRIGIYEHDPATGDPGALVVASAEIPIDATGFQSAPLAFTRDPAKEYWLTYLGQVAVALRGIATVGAGMMLGVTTPSATVPPTAISAQPFRTRSLTYTTLPNPWGTPSGTAQTGPRIFFKVA